MDRRRPGSQRRLRALYLIADVGFAERFDVDLVCVVEEFVRAGGRMVSLRPAGGDDRRVLDVGRELAGLLYAVGGTFLVHRRVDLALLLGADGVHLPSRGMRRGELEQLLGRSVIAGRSCHTGEDVECWSDDGGNFATLGPLFSSISKPDYGPEIGTGEFGAAARSTGLPVYALGGVVPERVAECFDAGARGVAVVGGLMKAPSVFEATREYLEAIEEAG